MTFLEFLKANCSELLTLTRDHVLLVFVSTGVAIALAVPLGVLLTRIKSLQTPVLGFANVMQTVPSLALFGLLIPLPFIGGIGARTAIIALALYALLPVIRNTVTGILGIDPKIREAAVAMGMTDWQRLKVVELPLAMPVILTGIRVAVVISVSVATVAAAVGAGGLGTYIFRGLRQNDNNQLLAGALASALLALIADFALGQLERSYRIGERASATRSRVVALGVAIAFVAILVSGPISNFMALDLPEHWQALLPESEISNQSEKTERPIVVGSKDFTESVILAEILAQMLEKEGVAITRQLELGGNLAHAGLLSGEIDVYPEYTGTAFTAILKHPPITDPETVYDRTKLEYAERFNLKVSPPLGFSNDFAILVRGDVARKNNLKTISDAVPIGRDWQAGFGQDFMSRADGYAGFAKAYGFNFNNQPREMDLALTYRALASGEVDIIAGNSTDGLIGVLDLVQLADDRRYFPPYQTVYIARAQIISDLAATFDRVANIITTGQMRQLNYEVDGNKRSPREVAAQWLAAFDGKH